MTLLIDAYNVLHCSHVLPDRYASVSATGLCRLVDRAEAHRGNRGRGRVVVVCDGRPKPDEDPGGDFGRVELLYSGPGGDADTIIERLIESDTDPRRLLVVSNDRRLQRAARRRRGRFISSEAFLRGLARDLTEHRAAPPEPEKPRTHGDVAMWMEKFGLTDEPPPDESEARDLKSETDHWLREFGFDPEQTR